MATYLLVDLIFILAVTITFRMNLRKPSKVVLLTLCALLLLTAMFDSLIVGFSIVSYNTDRILGIFIGNAPIEDFFYAVLAVMLVSTTWKLTENKDD